MKNVFLIPTEKPSRLFIIDGKLYNYHKPQQGDGVNEINQYIYITSDEKIKEGVEQWYLDKVLNEPYNSGGAQYSSKQDVIILTTDQDLIKDGVQVIDDEFLEWFVKNPSCEWVEVESMINMIQFTPREFIYKIIIPQEEPKQEIVINEKCSKCGSSQYQIGTPFCTDEFCNTNIGKASEDYWLKQPYNEDAFAEGAKWMAERMYSEEEVLKILYDWTIYKIDLMVNEKLDSILAYNEWFEQFKKK
jgi:hypothetical protein